MKGISCENLPGKEINNWEVTGVNGGWVGRGSPKKMRCPSPHVTLGDTRYHHELLTGHITLDCLVKVVSVGFLHCLVTLFPFPESLV